MSKITQYFGSLDGYGRSISIIIKETISSFLKEKRFYISVFYYILLPIFLVLTSAGTDAIQTGTGIAIYFAQLNTNFYITTLFLSFFPGQIFLVILSSDQIAGEVETDTLSLVMTKPVYHSEVVIGKFTGLMVILGILQIPSLLFTYYFNLIRYDAEFPFAFWTSIDEVVAMLILVLLIQAMIIALSLLISTIFDRSLYAILTAILSLFVISTISDGIGADPTKVNYFQLQYYINAILPQIFFNLEPLNDEQNILSLIMIVFGSIIVFLTTSNLVLRRKELF